MSPEVSEQDQGARFIYGSTSVPVLVAAVGLALTMGNSTDERQIWLVIVVLVAASLMPMIVQFPAVWWRSGDAGPMMDLGWRFTIPVAVALVVAPIMGESSLVVRVLAVLTIVSVGQLVLLIGRTSGLVLSDPFLLAVSLSCFAFTLVMLRDFESFITLPTVLSFLYGGANYLVVNGLRTLVIGKSTGPT